jgi:hypothetical protein
MAFLSLKMRASLNQLWKSIPALRGGSEATNMRLGDFLAATGVATVACLRVTLAAAATTVVAVPGALVGDVCSVDIATLHAADTAPTTADAVVTSAGVVTITPISTPAHSDDTCILTVCRVVSLAVAGHSENPGA